jgi:hypothetical protein
VESEERKCERASESEARSDEAKAEGNCELSIGLRRCGSQIAAGERERVRLVLQVRSSTTQEEGGWARTAIGDQLFFPSIVFLLTVCSKKPSFVRTTNCSTKKWGRIDQKTKNRHQVHTSILEWTGSEKKRAGLRAVALERGAGKMTMNRLC